MYQSAELGIHREVTTFRFFSFKKVSIISREKESELYGKWGANTQWLLDHPEVFKDDNTLYFLSHDEALDSGFVDRIIHWEKATHIEKIIIEMY